MSHAQNTNTRTLCQDIQQDLFVWWDAQQALSSRFTKKILTTFNLLVEFRTM